ncbi:type II toxin-antitoxin system PemK/MazF family toxin [Polynucleobacter antarcticus]
MRPVLVVSPGPFNNLTKMPMVLPITTGANFARVAGYTVD